MFIIGLIVGILITNLAFFLIYMRVYVAYRQARQSQLERMEAEAIKRFKIIHYN